MKLSLWIAVQSLASSWNQTLSNATGQWSGELDTLLFSDVLNWFSAQLQQSRVVVEYPAREASLIWTQIIRTNIKDKNNAGNRLGDAPQETAQE